MIINIIGDCDKRPMLYTIMKLAQSYGDALLISDRTDILRLSNTGESEGHYQNIMIAYTDEGIDDFWDAFEYNPNDYESIIVENIDMPNADVYILCESMSITENEEAYKEIIPEEKLVTCQLYSRTIKYFTVDTLYNMAEFESLRDMCIISEKLCGDVAKVMSKYMRVAEGDIYKTLLTQNFKQPRVSKFSIPGLRR